MTCIYLITDLYKVGLEKVGEILSKTTDAVTLSNVVYCAINANRLREGEEKLEMNQYEFLDTMAESKIFSNVDFIAEFTTAMMEAKVFQNDDNLGVPRKVRKTTKDPK